MANLSADDMSGIMRKSNLPFNQTGPICRPLWENGVLPGYNFSPQRDMFLDSLRAAILEEQNKQDLLAPSGDGSPSASSDLQASFFEESLFAGQDPPDGAPSQRPEPAFGDHFATQAGCEVTGASCERLVGASDAALELRDDIASQLAVLERGEVPITFQPPGLEDAVAVALESRRKHELGLCQPCSYFNFKQDGCRNGSQCSFCHLCSADEAKEQKKLRKKRSRMEKSKCKPAPKAHEALSAQAAPMQTINPALLVVPEIAPLMQATEPGQQGLFSVGVGLTVPGYDFSYTSL